MDKRNSVLVTVGAFVLGVVCYRAVHKRNKAGKDRKLILGGIETGGTHVAVFIAEDTPTNIIQEISYPTTDPEVTIQQAIDYLKQKRVDCVGIASFGPLELNPASPHYGYITSTPKPGWKDTDIYGMVKHSLVDVPVGIQTDVNASALSECYYGGHNVSSCCYITVGAGVGVGVCVKQEPVVGLCHPEGGHVSVPLHPRDTEMKFDGTCPFHGACIEGVLSAGALAKRAGVDRSQLKDLPDSHWVWEIAGYYLGRLCSTIVFMVSPEIIVVGGGVCQRKPVIEFARKECVRSLNGYISKPKVMTQIDSYIVPSKYGKHSGAVGALEIGRLRL